ncbi:16S rRNA (guanine(527)-N(7))-methyltransferase RsmG [Piscinibacter sakaiensis]|uniref:16S rRNA (guanine(527)-N(7))-methyltransferase RsmG n=1 Tax=Piscinibacter sakaiensis TaxID=1547922 RepID=UPI003AADBA87
MPLESAAAQLEQAADKLGISLDSRQIGQLVGHIDLLAKWNKAYNLTAVRDPADMVRQHLVDSLAIVPPLRRHLQAASGDESATLVDVGSGAGFPGLTIAIALPACQVTCVDSVGKKVGFIRQVIAELGLQNARALHARIEDLSPLAADVITSRAFASLNDFTRLTRSHLSEGRGTWMAMKGRRPDDELAALPAAVDVFHVEHLHPPDLDGERCLVWMRPTG